MEYRQTAHLICKSNIKRYEKYRVDCHGSVYGVVGFYVSAANANDYRTGCGLRWYYGNAGN